mmetsp:Transcript_3311/g.5503  ORF Transcript_3311/g.5503 Transcript_3311/m.5503 type:complete len:112 (+) Transcript_3311:1165-1500(+)
MPSRYDKFLRSTFDLEEDEAMRLQVERDLEQVKRSVQAAFKESSEPVKRPQKLVEKFRARFGKKAQTEVIEVFDVLIQSRRRLVIFDMEKGCEFIMNPDKSNYASRFLGLS